MNEDMHNNIAETLAMEMRKPFEIAGYKEKFVRRIALPPGWTVKEIDDEPLLMMPRRKKCRVALDDTESFIEYLNMHTDHSSDCATMWVTVDYGSGKVGFCAILNDHGADPESPDWRDHLATFRPTFSSELQSWTSGDGKSFSQVEFAAFLERNVSDISGDGTDGPSGAQMLQMALNFEANQEKRFRSAIRLQSGGFNMAFVEQDDAQTVETMKMFDRFAIGIPIFWGGEAYRIEARLTYRVREGKLTFSYDLIRKDKVIEAATKTIVGRVKDRTGISLFFGNAFSA